MRPTRYPYQKIPLSDTTKVLDVIHSLELLSMDFNNFKELTERAQQPVRKLVECYINDLKGICFEVVPISLKLRLHEQLEFFGYALELLEHGQVLVYGYHG